MDDARPRSMQRSELAGSSILPTLTAVAVAMFAMTALALLVYLDARDPALYRAALVANLIGEVAALAAAGMIDRPRVHGDARAIGALAGATVVAFAASAAVLAYGWHLGPSGLLAATVPLALAVVGLVLIAIIGLLATAAPRPTPTTRLYPSA